MSEQIIERTPEQQKADRTKQFVATLKQVVALLDKEVQELGLKDIGILKLPDGTYRVELLGQQVGAVTQIDLGERVLIRNINTVEYKEE